LKPTIRLAAGQGRRLRDGAPWVFSNEIAMKPEYRRMEPGGLVALEDDNGAKLGTAMFNPHSLIAARMLDRDPPQRSTRVGSTPGSPRRRRCASLSATARSTALSTPRPTGCPA